MGLTSLAIIANAMVRLGVDETKESMHINDKKALYLLVRLTEESKKFDRGTFFLAYPEGRSLLVNHYSHLLIGPRKSPEVCLNGDQHAQTALRILEFLCDYPPHPIRYQQDRINRIKHRAPGCPCYLLPHRIVARTMRITSLGFARKWREKKHRHGVVLSSPSLYLHKRLSAQDVCSLGLFYLPKILEQSSRSTELVDFILGHGKDLVYIPGETRKSIRAMHEYLDRANEDLDIVID
jgi:hypothetical protein